MSISATKRSGSDTRAFRTLLAYGGVTVFCVLFNRIYGVFGHGVTSAAMTWMFLYPLLGGALPFLLLWRLLPGAFALPHSRFFYNAYNSGIAALTLESALRGVFEIAGTSSPRLVVLTLSGWGFCLLGWAGFSAALLRSHRRN